MLAQDRTKVLNIKMHFFAFLHLLPNLIIFTTTSYQITKTNIDRPRISQPNSRLTNGKSENQYPIDRQTGK